MSASEVSTIADATAVEAPRRSMKSLGRRVGLLFLFHGLPAPFALLVVPRRIFVAGDVTATADLVPRSVGAPP